ncbi:enoyl-CoA hydratase/isomerase family protein [Novosphingobium sp. KCTC 2891]|uniref:enoyl-CoA hydratase/isomerase family protein n=1 Tax=Novosphingobium sp. KCTC 2891 TaxID=2989730 RepID=UPI002223A930|nr:enoyl-CoA hydratase/isomerase family protein [Novosphingobium sp. KCTC 2891]MCW1384895.1 enoyl-CoA hydratase/isomerase family protein [Novosphingobium sp. KCTC 2891]
MNFQTLTLTFDGNLAEIRLIRPDLLNRFDMPAHIEFVEAIEQIKTRLPQVRALVLSAEGRAFSAGGDFEEMLQAHADKDVRDGMVTFAKGVYYGISRLPIPVIVAVQGAAIGLGATIATLCDIVVAWKGAKFADTHVNVGLVAGDGGVVSWSQSIGVNRAKRYLLTGDIITGEQAYAFGLVTELVETPEDALPRARELAARAAALAPLGINGTKQAFSRITDARAAEAFEYGLELEMVAMASPDLPATIEALRKK